MLEVEKNVEFLRMCCRTPPIRDLELASELSISHYRKERDGCPARKKDLRGVLGYSPGSVHRLCYLLYPTYDSRVKGRKEGLRGGGWKLDSRSRPAFF